MLCAKHARLSVADLWSFLYNNGTCNNLVEVFVYDSVVLYILFLCILELVQVFSTVNNKITICFKSTGISLNSIDHKHATNVTNTSQPPNIKYMKDALPD